MAVLRLTFIILLHCLLLINVNSENLNEDLNDYYRPQIWSLVKYLNSNPNRVYNYNYATLINAQIKDDEKTDLSVDIEVECHNPDSGLCITSILTCQGSVQYNTEDAKYDILSEPTCRPKTIVDLTKDDETETEAGLPEEEKQSSDGGEERIEATAELELNHEVGDVATSGEQFIAVPKTQSYCVGCPFDLDTNAVGVQRLTDVAIKHIESERQHKQQLVRVLRIQQQVVSGIKTILLIEITPTGCPKNSEPSECEPCVTDTYVEPEICEIEYIQQPWISKSKNIIRNNCTVTQTFAEESSDHRQPSNDLDNEIDVNYDSKKPANYPTNSMDTEDNQPNYDSIADTGLADDMLKIRSGGIMSPAQMREIESQIIYKKPETTPVPPTTEESVLTDEQKSALADFYEMMGDEPRAKRAANKDNNNDDSSSSSSSSSSDDDDDNDNDNGKEKEKVKEKQKKKSRRHDDDDDNDVNNNNNNNNNDDSSSSSSSSSSDEDDKNDQKKNKRDAIPKDDNSSSSSSSDEDDKNDQKKLKREAVPKDDNSSSSSSSDEDDKHKRETVAKDDNSSSSSSSDEDDKEDKKKHKREAVLKADDSSSSSSSSSEEDVKNRTKRSVPVPDEKKELTEEKKQLTDEKKQLPEEKKQLPGKKKQSSEESQEESSEEFRGGVRRKRSLNLSNQLVKISPDEKVFVHNLADFAVSTLDDIDADTHKRVILQVLGAKKMPSDGGFLYHLTLRVGVSHCSEEQIVRTDLTANKEYDECRERLFENLTKICKVQVHVTEDKTDPKVVKSHCQNIKRGDDNSDANRTHRLKRGGLPGGVNQVDPNDPNIKKIATDILAHLDREAGGEKKQELVEVLSASKQIVSGILYKLKVKVSVDLETRNCDLELWDQPWLKQPKQLKVTCDGADEKKYRYKRSHYNQFLGKDDHDIHMGLFKDFTYKFNKTYSNKSEFKKRFYIFRQNMKTIQQLNKLEQGSAKYGATMFADLSRDEFKRYLGLNPSLRNPNDIPMPHADIPKVDLPTEFDWRKKGVVSEVKNQGMCGSCWAFSVTGNIEGQNAIKTGKMIELSEQELVDCDKLDDGCSGGLPDNAYRAIEQLGGLESESDYPYDGENEKCHFNKTLSRVQISGAVNISRNETDMAKWLIKNGPISIGINANAMQFYMGGVSHPFKFLCSPDNLDHGVLIVGYGVHKYPLFNKMMPYWIVKNSWGPHWGEQGYYRVFRGDGTCGLNQMASSAVL